MTRGNASADRFVRAFHAGERWAIEDTYREHAARVIAAAQRLVGPVDAETIAHDVFRRLLESKETRESFQGGNLGAWLTQVAVRSAVDELRKRRREVPANADDSGKHPASDEPDLDAKLLIDRFRTEVLAPADRPIFEARFMQHVPQRDAAKALGIPRSTLIYQERRIRELLERFLLR